MSEETQAPIDPATTDSDGWEWMLLEVMGHRSHWGRAREEERFGTKMLRIDVPIKGDPAVNGWSTHYYSGAAIFSYALTDEATALARNKPWEPPARLTLPAPGAPDATAFDPEDDDVPFNEDGEEAA